MYKSIFVGTYVYVYNINMIFFVDFFMSDLN